MFERFAKFFLDNQKITLVVITTIAFFWMLAYVMLPKQYNPSIVAPAFEIKIPVAGYTSDQASRFVVRELENRLHELPRIDKLYGYAEDGFAAVTVSFKVWTDLEEAKTRLYDKLSSNLASKPYGVQDISIRSIDPEELPQVAFALTFSGTTDLSPIETGIYLRSVASRIKEEIKHVDGTSNLEILGWYENHLRITPDLRKLETKGITLPELVSTLRDRIGEKSLGVLETEGKRSYITVSGAKSTEQDLKDLPIRDAEWSKVYLRDIASIGRGPSDAASYYSFRKTSESSLPTVFLAVSKEKGTNAVSVVEWVLERMKELSPTLPRNVSIEIIQNEGDTAREATSELLFHLALSIGIVFLVLVVFLWFRNALNAAFCIPMVLGIVFIVALVFGIDINRITLFALILSLGILVDDSIVVVENNARHLSERHASGKTRKEALLASVKEVGVSIVLSTVTRILSFLGMFAVTGMMGDYMRPIPVFASIALTASLFVAFSINPFLANLLSKREKHDVTERHGHSSEPRFLDSYEKLLKRFIGKDTARVRRRRFLKPAFWISLLLIITLPIAIDIFRARMLPKADKDQVYLWIDLPRSYGVEEANKAVDRASALLTGDALPERLRIVESVSSSVGDRFLPDFPNLFRWSQDRLAPSQASMRINLTHAKERKISSEEFTIEVRPILREAILSAYPDATIRLLEDPPGPPTIATLHLKMKSDEDTTFDNLVRFSEAVERMVRSIASEEAIEDIATTKSRSLPQTKIVLDQEKMREIGISRQAVDAALVFAYNDQTVGMVDTPEGVILQESIILSLRKDDRNHAELASLPIAKPDGSIIRLDQIAGFEPGWMNRETYTEDRASTVHLYAEMGSNSVVYPILRLYSVFDSDEFKQLWYRKVSANPYGIEFESVTDGKKYRIEWGGEWELTMDTFRDMWTAMILSLLAIYFLVVAEFKSFRTGGIIMMTFLFSFFGIFPGFGLLYLISGTYFTATAMIGAIALGGIVVWNAIILLDYVEQLRKDGNSLEQSVIEGSKKRFIPVILTSIAAVLGSVIIASDPVWSGLAWSIVFWLSASALLTLFFVPVFFYDLELRRKPQKSDGELKRSITI